MCISLHHSFVLPFSLLLFALLHSSSHIYFPSSFIFHSLHRTSYRKIKIVFFGGGGGNVVHRSAVVVISLLLLVVHITIFFRLIFMQRWQQHQIYPDSITTGMVREQTNECTKMGEKTSTAKHSHRCYIFAKFIFDWLNPNVGAIPTYMAYAISLH